VSLVVGLGDGGAVYSPLQRAFDSGWVVLRV
jgi:hypothetical protein